MSTSLTISGLTDRHVMTLTADDISLLLAVADHRFFILVNGSKAEETAIARTELSDIASALLKDVQSQWLLLPYRYMTEARIKGRDTMASRGSGGISGFHIEGKVRGMRAGPGYCYISEPGDTGAGILIKRNDVRDRKVVETDDWGPIKISRRKLQVTLPEQLQQLLDFLFRCQDAELKLTAAEGPLSVKKLVRLAAEGDEGAEEELFDRGEDAKRELLQMAANPKVRKDCETIARLLLTVFPSVESRQAVEAMAKREADEQRRNSLLTLLQAST